PVKLTGIRFYTSNIAWYSPYINVSIQEGSGWTEITADLNNLYLYGKMFSMFLPGGSSLLKNVSRIEFCFEADTGKDCVVDIDEFSFEQYQTENRFGYTFEQMFLALLHPFRSIWALIMALV
ncbi:MAG: hypothetical protein FWF08_00760, partial [Oscillospiraceae bacterium]|nr:hypothetical protein [Oscillospiraceae bacterium]